MEMLNKAFVILPLIPSARHQGSLFTRGFCGHVANLRAGHWVKIYFFEGSGFRDHIRKQICNLYRTRVSTLGSGSKIT